MPRFDYQKTVERKIPIVMNSAKIINERYEKGEVTQDEAMEQMILFAKGGNFLRFWFDIDDQIRMKHETASWFWLIRRVRNIKHTL